MLHPEWLVVDVLGCVSFLQPSHHTACTMDSLIYNSILVVNGPPPAWRGVIITLFCGDETCSTLCGTLEPQIRSSWHLQQPAQAMGSLRVVSVIGRAEELGDLPARDKCTREGERRGKREREREGTSVVLRYIRVVTMAVGARCYVCYCCISTYMHLISRHTQSTTHDDPIHISKRDFYLFEHVMS